MKKTKVSCDLKSCDFCKRCLPEWLPAIDANRQNQLFKKGKILFTEGEPVTGMYFINSGVVKVHKKWSDEKELIIRFANKGAIIGHRGLGSELIFPVSATVIEDASVCFIPLEFFNASLKVNHDFLYWLMLFFADELKLSERRMRNLAHMSVKGRLALALINLKDKFGTQDDGSIDIQLSKQDLASYAGATYETVFRILNEMEEEKLITVSGKSIQIISAEELVKISQPPL